MTVQLLFIGFFYRITQSHLSQTSGQLNDFSHIFLSLLNFWEDYHEWPASFREQQDMLASLFFSNPTGSWRPNPLVIISVASHVGWPDGNDHWMNATNSGFVWMPHRLRMAKVYISLRVPSPAATCNVSHGVTTEIPCWEGKKKTWLKMVIKSSERSRF